MMAIYRLINAKEHNTEGIKRFLSSDDDVDLRMQEFRAKVASGEHVNNAALAQWYKEYNKGE